MCAIANGIAAFAPNTFLPITSSFFMFYLYAAPAVRMGALMNLHVIHLATHDSIGMGEDGPTHQPVELAALFRAMPDLLYLRPADCEEVAGAWKVAIDARTPSIISTSRHALPQLRGTRRQGVELGAYVIEEVEGPEAADVTLMGTGAELCFAVDAAAGLRRKGFKVRVVSFPCWRLFERQGRGYRREVLQRGRGVPAVVVEAYVAVGWERYADAGVCMRGFGKSLPGRGVYGFFGFEVEGIVERVEGYLGRVREDEELRREFVEL